MIAEGFAHEYTYQSNPYKYQTEFIQAEREARENKKGLWADNACPTTTSGNSATNAPSTTKTTTPAPTPTPQPSQTVSGSSGSYVCNCAKTCAQMSSCAEAQYQLNVCGCSRRDADGDGVACDADCQ